MMSRNLSALTISALLWLGIVFLHAQTRSTAPKAGATPASAPTPPQPAVKFPSPSTPATRASSPLALPDLTAASDGIVIGGQRVPWGGSVTLYPGSSAGPDNRPGNVIFQGSPSAGAAAKQGDLLKQKEVLHNTQNKLPGMAKDPTQQGSSCRFPYSFTAQNIGGGPLPASVFYLMSTEDGRGLAGGTSPNARLDPLGPGQQKRISGDIDLPRGPHILRLALDQTRQVNELNRANNNFQITVNVDCTSVKDKAVTGALAPSSKEPYMTAIRNLTADQGRWEARVKAKGLDPKDPNLSSKLAKLAAQDTQIFAAQHRASALHIMPAALPKSPVLPGSQQSAKASSAKLATAPAAPPANSGSLAGVKSASSIPLVTPEIRGLLNWTEQPWSPVQQFDNRHQYMLLANWDQLFPAQEKIDVFDNAITELDLGECGSLEIRVNIGGGKFQRVPPLHKEPAAVLLANMVPIPGNHVKPGALSLRVRGVVSNPIQVTKVKPSEQTATATMGIVATDPHLSGWSGAGLQTSHLALGGNGDRISTTPENQGGQGGSGTDILGRGVYLMNGYTATARIVSAHSYMDAPNDNQPDDSYRGASIVQQPQNGRLETKVAWHYAAGESIDYVIEWELKGTYGVRPLSTMPRAGTCGD